MTDTADPVDVLVIGGGPAGAAAGWWLASQGHDVAIVERRSSPRDKPCGGALAPRAVRQLTDMGLADVLAGAHRTDGLRLTGLDREIVVPWPDHPTLPAHGCVVRRRDLDARVLDAASGAGASILEGHDAVAPIVERGFVRGALVAPPGSVRAIERRARFVVVADGANSRFGRALGTFRTRNWPYATAIRSYWESPRHSEAWLEAGLDLKDRAGNRVAGFGWVFPLGDGTVNVGVGLLSTYPDFKSVNMPHLLEAFAESVADRWSLDPARPLQPPVSGRVPMGGSVEPKAGPTYLVVGDAAGMANPYNGDGIAAAYETGRLAAGVLHEAMDEEDGAALRRYPVLLEKEYGQYFRVARLFDRLVGRPAVLHELTRTALHSRTLAEWTVRVMANALRPDERGMAEAAYRAIAAITRMVPDG